MPGKLTGRRVISFRKDRWVPEHDKVILGTGYGDVEQIISTVKEVSLIQIAATVDRRKENNPPLCSLEGMHRTDLHLASWNARCS